MASDLQVVLSLVDDFTKNLTGVRGELATFGKEVDNLRDSLIKIGGAFAGAFAVDKIKSVVNSGIAYGDEIKRMTAMTGLQSDEAQKLNYVFKEMGSSIENMQRPIRNLSVEALKNNEAFKLLGIETRNSKGEIKDSGQILEDTIIKLSGVQNTTERAALAQKLFGKGAGDVLKIISEGPEKIKELMDETKKYGLILDESTIKKLDEAKKAQDRMDMSMKVLSADFAVNFTPAIIEVTKQISDFVSAWGWVLNHKEQEQKVADMTAVNLKLVETTSRIAELKKTIATPFSIVPDWVPKNQSLQKTLDDLQKQQKELEHYGEKPKQTHVAGIDDLFNGGGDEQKGIAKAYYKWIDDQKNEKLKEGKEALDKEIALEKQYYKWIDDQKNEKLKTDKESMDAQEKAWKDFHKRQWEEEKKHTEEMVQLSVGMGESIGALIGENLGKGREGMKNVMKGVLLDIVSFLEKQALATIASETLKNVMLLGPAGFLTGAVEAGAITALAEGAKAGIGSFAEGTSYAPGGLSVVGERGPEMMYVPRGAQILSNSQSNSTSNNYGGHTINYNHYDYKGTLHESLTAELRSGNAQRFVDELINKIGKS